ncbi:MAG: hypothetical protein ACTSWY_05070 [Promethearchaeota archaeon]
MITLKFAIYYYKYREKILERKMNQKTVPQIRKGNIKDDFFMVLLSTIFGFLYIITLRETTPLWVRILVISLPFVVICISYIITKLVHEERGNRFFFRVRNIFWFIFFLSIFEILYIITKLETTPLWTLILFVSLPELVLCNNIIIRELVHKERGRNFFVESEKLLDKENQKIKREEMNRSITRIKKIRIIGGFFNILLYVILIFLLFFNSPETTPLWVRILALSPSILIISRFPKIKKYIQEERRKKFIEKTDVTFDREELMDEHKTILKDLKNNIKEIDQSPVKN